MFAISGCIVDAGYGVTAGKAAFRYESSFETNEQYTDGKRCADDESVAGAGAGHCPRARHDANRGHALDERHLAVQQQRNDTAGSDDGDTSTGHDGRGARHHERSDSRSHDDAGTGHNECADSGRDDDGESGNDERAAAGDEHGDERNATGAVDDSAGGLAIGKFERDEPDFGERADLG